MARPKKTKIGQVPGDTAHKTEFIGGRRAKVYDRPGYEIVEVELDNLEPTQEQLDAEDYGKKRPPKVDSTKFIRAKTIKGLLPQFGDPITLLNPITDGVLTRRQELFVMHLCAGTDTATAAARASGADPRLNRHAWWHVGHRLRTAPGIAEIVSDRLRRQREHVLHDREALRSFVLTNIADIAVNTQDDRVRLRAIELLGKTDIAGSFADRKEVTITHNRKADDLKTEIIAKMRVLLGDKVIEADAVDAPRIEQSLNDSGTNQGMDADDHMDDAMDDGDPWEADGMGETPPEGEPPD